MTIADHVAERSRDTLEAASSPRVLEPTGLDPSLVDRLAVTGEPWGTATADELFARHGGIGLVVLHRGRLAYERYASDAVADRANLCFSITKSVTGTIAALLRAAGRLEGNAAVADLLPDLAGSGVADASVTQIADMTASIAYDEDYDEATAPSTQTGWRGFGDYMVAIGLDDGADDDDRPRTVRDLVRAIGPGAGPHGQVFAYATPVADTLGWLVETTDGRDGRDTLDDLIWSRIGAEHEGRLTRDPAGVALMGAGLSMTTRDLARIGAILAAGGAGADGTVAIDPEVIEAIRDGGDPEVFGRNDHYAYLKGYRYRDQWWLPGGASRPLSAWGIYGQVLWVDPDADVVVAYHCGGPLPSDPQRDLEQDALCRAIVEASSGWT